MPRRRILAAKLDGGSILHVMHRREAGFHGLMAACQLQIRLDRADQEALPIRKRRKLPLCLGFCQCLQLANLLEIGIRGRSRGGMQQLRRCEAQTEEATTVFWRSLHL
jgi:hypothetical protein